MPTSVLSRTSKKWQSDYKINDSLVDFRGRCQSLGGVQEQGPDQQNFLVRLLH